MSDSLASTCVEPETEEALKQKISQLEELPTLPDYFAELMDCLGNADTGNDQLANILAKDAALTGKILKLANSAYYGRYRKVATPTEAVVTIGSREVKAMALSISVFEAFSAAVSEAELQKVWRHALLSASAIQVIGPRHLEMPMEHIYIGALLHDIGQLALWVLMGDEYADLNHEAKSSGKNLSELEIQRFGADHAAIGGWILENWRLPIDLVDLVANHHELPDDSIRLRSIATLQIASYLSDRIDLDVAASKPDKAQDLLLINDDVLDELGGRLNSRLPDIESTLLAMGV